MKRLFWFPVLLFAIISAAQQTPTFTARSEVVLVPAAVRDKSGKVASGLKQDSFRLTVDGKPVPIASFEEVKSGTRPALLPREKDVFTNRIANEDKPQRLTVLLLDYLNTPFLNQEEERQEVAKFVDREIKADEPIAILSLTRSGLHMLQTFTTSSGDLSLAVQRSRGELSLYEANGLHWVGSPAEDFSGHLIMRDRIQLTLDELEQLGNALAGVPGRKVVVWMSGGFPYLPYDRQSLTHVDTEFTDSYQHAFRTLNQSNVSLYTIDAKGLVNTLFEQRFSPEHRNAPRLPARPRYDIAQQEQDTLRAFAAETGGIACMNRNQYESCIESAQQEAVDYYLLSFNITPEMRAKDWHKIQVKVEGKYDVRTRQGFGIEKVTAPDPKREMQLMGKALRSPLEYTGIKMSLRWLEVKPIPAGQAPAPFGDQDPAVKHPPVAVARFRLEFAPRAVEIDTANNNHLGLTVMALCLNTANEPVCGMAKGMETNLTDEQVRNSDRNGTGIQNEILLPAGHLRVRLALRDRRTGQIGSIEAPIDVKAN